MAHPRTAAWLTRAITGLLLIAPPLLAQEQVADPAFDAHVKDPAYAHGGPVVAIDEAHRNFHTAGGRYMPLADLLRADGYRVTSSAGPFSAANLAGIGVMIVANAGVPVGTDLSVPAFTEVECDTLRDWVRDGGSLLLVSDHAPFGGAIEPLAHRFGIDVGKGWAFEYNDAASGLTTQLTFSRENGRLGDHPILRGRNPSEAVTRIRSFTGTSLSVPPGATALMRLSDAAREAPTPMDLDAADAAIRDPKSSPRALDAYARSAAGRAQGIAMRFGRGRLVMMGEAAMLSAQVVRFTDAGQPREMRMGMNVPGSDDRQFALNVLHWLSRVLDQQAAR